MTAELKQDWTKVFLGSQYYNLDHGTVQKIENNRNIFVVEQHHDCLHTEKFSKLAAIQLCSDESWRVQQSHQSKTSHVFYFPKRSYNFFLDYVYNF